MESPEFVHFSGKGKFFLDDDSTVESTFVLYRNPYWIGITAREETLCEAANKSFSDRAGVRLSGTLNDGRVVKAESLHIVKIQLGTNPDIEFTASEGVMIGQGRDIPPEESRFPLTGYFDGEFSIVYNGWNINTIPCPNTQNAQECAKKWRCPTEGMMLQLKRKNFTIKQHRDFARVVMTMLSLASGTGVSCNRHSFIWPNEELEIWRHMTGDEIGPGSIVPEFERGKFLEQTLPAWFALSQDQQNALRLALHYINQSALGYMDIRLFHIVQPWEFLAQAWEANGALSDHVTSLRSRLQQARKQWNDDYPNSDPQGFWGSRISSIFEWQKLRNAIERLASSFGLDLELLELDLDLLKKTRDSVAHSGKLPDQFAEPDRKVFLDLLTKGQYCLQLLLLRILSYQGMVCNVKGGWHYFEPIEQALAKACLK